VDEITYTNRVKLILQPGQSNRTVSEVLIHLDLYSSVLHVEVLPGQSTDLGSDQWTQGLRNLTASTFWSVQDLTIMLDLGHRLRRYVRPLGLPILWKTIHLFTITRIRITSQKRPLSVTLRASRRFGGKLTQLA
jgi:hypothetical protein